MSSIEGQNRQQVENRLAQQLLLNPNENVITNILFSFARKK
jgi:hypothetical protein